MFGIPSLLYGHDGLDESLLKDVVGKLLVLYYAKDISVNSIFMAFEQYVECLITVIGISCDQFAVGELSQLHRVLRLGG